MTENSPVAAAAPGQTPEAGAMGGGGAGSGGDKGKKKNEPPAVPDIATILGNQPGLYGIIGRSPAMLKVYDVIRSVAELPVTVYIAGESGTGKEMVARALHAEAHRVRHGAFVACNVGALADGTLESELFGHERGAFTDAKRTKQGVFREAHEGTLFLDEIAAMNPKMQVEILRVVQEGTVVPVGGNYANPIEVDVRIVAASSKPLREYVDSWDFREDLYYRLNVVTIHLPPLRERGDDIRVLADHFRKIYAERFGAIHPWRKNITFDPTVYEAFSRYSWPGNVRELEHAIEGAMARTKKEVLSPEDFVLTNGETETLSLYTSASLPSAQLPPIGSGSLKERLGAYERAMIDDALRSSRGNIAQAGRELGIERSTINRKLVEYGIDPDSYRSP